MLQPVWIVGFTGHRPGAGPGRSAEALRGCRARLRELLTNLQQRAADRGGTIELLTGVAAGADMEAAEVASELNIPVHVILPLPEAMFATDFAGTLAADCPRANRLIELAQNGHGGGTLRIAAGDNTRPGCYHEANLQMLAVADVIVAVWNGEPAGGVGGTAELIDEAARLEQPCVVINPAADTASEYLGNWDGWPEPDVLLDKLNVAANEAASADRGPEERGGEGSAWKAFVALDEAAKHSGSRFRGRLLWSMRLYFLAALLAGGTAAFAPVMRHHAQPSGGRVADVIEFMPQASTCLEFVLVAIAFGLMWQTRRRQTHERWRRTRFAAEVAHSLIVSARLLDPLQPLILRCEPSWRRFALSMSLLSYRSTSELSNIEQQKAEYLRGRVLDQRDHYFGRHHPDAEKRKRCLSRVGFYAATTAPLFIGLALLLKLFAPDWIAKNYFAAGAALFLPFAVPLLAGAATSLVLAMDVGRRAERYRDVGARLDRIARLIPGLKTRGALSRIVAETEEMLLDELVEWYAAAKQTAQ